MDRVADQLGDEEDGGEHEEDHQDADTRRLAKYRRSRLPLPMEFYRLRWDLADLCDFARWFAGPHEQTADTDMAWQSGVAICQRLGARS